MDEGVDDVEQKTFFLPNINLIKEKGYDYCFDKGIFHN